MRVITSNCCRFYVNWVPVRAITLNLAYLPTYTFALTSTVQLRPGIIGVICCSWAENRPIMVSGAVNSNRYCPLVSLLNWKSKCLFVPSRTSRWTSGIKTSRSWLPFIPLGIDTSFLIRETERTIKKKSFFLVQICMQEEKVVIKFEINSSEWSRSG